MPKRHNGLDSPTVFVLITDNKFDFYNITEIANKKYRILDRVLKNVIVRRVFTIHQLATLFDNRFRKRYNKNKSKLLVITDNFFLSDPQITKQDKDWLYPQMIQTHQKGWCRFYNSCLFSYEIVKFNELWIMIRKDG